MQNHCINKSESFQKTKKKDDLKEKEKKIYLQS